MARAAFALAVLAAGCGLASRDYDVVQPFTAGGGAPPFTGSINATDLTGPLSGDVSKISSITLKAARIEAADSDPHDISFVSGARISVSSNLQAAKVIASLTSPAPAGQSSVQLTVQPTELKPYLESSGTITATIDYSPTPITARALRLVLTVHGSLL